MGFKKGRDTGFRDPGINSLNITIEAIIRLVLIHLSYRFYAKLISGFLFVIYLTLWLYITIFLCLLLLNITIKAQCWRWQTSITTVQEAEAEEKAEQMKWMLGKCFISLYQSVSTWRRSPNTLVSDQWHTFSTRRQLPRTLLIKCTCIFRFLFHFLYVSFWVDDPIFDNLYCTFWGRKRAIFRTLSHWKLISKFMYISSIRKKISSVNSQLSKGSH